jgi:hypothetical protein
MITDEATDEWVSTNHDRVFYRSDGDEWNRGEYALAKFITDHIPGWTVVITMGPYRGHDIRHEVHPDDKLIHLDCYSAGMIRSAPGHSSRTQHPMEEYAESLLDDIAQLIRDSDPDFNLTHS